MSKFAWFWSIICICIVIYLFYYEYQQLMHNFSIRHEREYINDNVDMLHDSIDVLICLDRGKICQNVLLDIALKRDQKTTPCHSHTNETDNKAIDGICHSR